MADRWRDDDWRWRQDRGQFGDRPFGGRRPNEGDYGYRTSQYRDYPSYDNGPDAWPVGGGWLPYDGPHERDYPESMGYRDEQRARYGNMGGQYNRQRDYRSEDRDWFDKAGDEVSSWFGDRDAERRREMDAQRQGGHRGRGPRGYTRSDDRITEDINDRLTDDWHVDASEINVSVSNGEVTLSGTVHDRNAKRRAEDIAESVSGVKDVQNNIRVQQQAYTGNQSGMAGSTTGMTASGTGLGKTEDNSLNRPH